MTAGIVSVMLPVPSCCCCWSAGGNNKTRKPS